MNGFICDCTQGAYHELPPEVLAASWRPVRLECSECRARFYVLGGQVYRSFGWATVTIVPGKHARNTVGTFGAAVPPALAAQIRQAEGGGKNYAPTNAKS